MRLIRQHSKTDCGIAVLAMIAGVPYATAKEALFDANYNGSTWTNKDDLVEAGAKLGVTFSKRFVRCVYPERLHRDALIRTNLLSTGNWHWVVWDSRRRKILDPLPYKRGLSPISQLTVLRRVRPDG